jgi:competence ComEA-like helix-hairpin-helix protein
MSTGTDSAQAALFRTETAPSVSGSGWGQAGTLPVIPDSALTRWLLQRLTPGSVILWLSTAVVLGLLGGQWIWLSNQRPEPLLIIPAARSTDFELDINSATWVEWVQLKGIGPNLANRIVADRRLRGPYRSPADLQRVSGIGPETLQRLDSALTIRHEHSITENETAYP